MTMREMIRKERTMRSKEKINKVDDGKKWHKEK
jgi:hypothetical protein